MFTSNIAREYFTEITNKIILTETDYYCAVDDAR